MYASTRLLTISVGAASPARTKDAGMFMAAIYDGAVLVIFLVNVSPILLMNSLKGLPPGLTFKLTDSLTCKREWSQAFRAAASDKGPGDRCSVIGYPTGRDLV